MFEPFSREYYLAELYVEPYDGERAAIQRADHERVNRRLYAADDEGIDRLDAPLVMKLDGSHFPVVGDDGVPTGTLAVPREIAADDLPTSRPVFLAEADRADELLRYAGWRAPSGT